MKVSLQFVRRLYSLLLLLYPHKFREEYGEELQAVFNLSLEAAITKSRLELSKLILRELAHMPRALLLEHLRERRLKMTRKLASRFDFAPGSPNEIFTALAPFIFGMIMVFLGYLGRFLAVPVWWQITFVILFWSSVLGMYWMGSARGLPRWFLPYIGLPLPLVCLLIFTTLLDPKWPGFDVPWLVGAILMEGFLWGWLILFMVALLLVSAWVPGFRPFYGRLRDDWTLLSFLLYGAGPMALFITFNEYKNVEPFFFTSLLFLAVGGWLYLRNSALWKRFWSLFSGLALAMFTAAVGKAVLYASSFAIHSFTWQSELVYTLVTWAWLAFIMLIPPAFNVLSRSRNRAQTT